jgi:hypothetical protein
MRRVGMAVLAAAVLGLGTAAAQAPAADGWRREFDEVCARTQDAMVLSTEELKSLVGRCDRLRPTLEGLAESERKVWVKRLAGCRNLYAYVLEAREAAQAR